MARRLCLAEVLQVEIRLSGGHQNKENQNMENTGAIHSEVSQTQTVHTGKATSQCGAK